MYRSRRGFLVVAMTGLAATAFGQEQQQQPPPPFRPPTRGSFPNDPATLPEVPKPDRRDSESQSAGNQEGRSAHDGIGAAIARWPGRERYQRGPLTRRAEKMRRDREASEAGARLGAWLTFRLKLETNRAMGPPTQSLPQTSCCSSGCPARILDRGPEAVASTSLTPIRTPCSPGCLLSLRLEQHESLPQCDSVCSRTESALQ